MSSTGGYDPLLNFQSFGGNIENIMYFNELLAEKAQLGARRGLNAFCKILYQGTKDAIKNPPKTGIKYPQLRVRSSAPNEYPANQTGKLRRSVGYQIDGYTRAYLGATQYYAYFLALGTRKMKKRAFIDRQMKENIARGYDIISTEINKALEI